MGNKGQNTIIPGEMTKMNRARMANLRRNTYVPNMKITNVSNEEISQMADEGSDILSGFNGSKIVNNYRKETNEIILPGETNPALEELRMDAPVEEKGFFDFSSLFGAKGGRRLTRKSRTQRKRRSSRKSRTQHKKSSKRSTRK